MKNLSQHFAALAITLWVGSLFAIGYLAVPVLFYAQPDKQLAGMLSGVMLTKVGYLSIVCGSYLLLQRLGVSGKTALRQIPFWLIAGMLLIALILQCGLQPAMVDLKKHDISVGAYADQFRMLHGISSVAYLIECLMGFVLVFKTRGGYA